MKLLHGLRFALAAVAALASQPGEVGPRYAPREGSTWQRRIELRTAHSLESCLLGWSKDRDPWDLSDIVWTSDQTLRLGTTDTYRAVEGERPSALRRTFDEVSVELLVEGEPARRAESPLQGCTVDFDWLDDDESPDMRFVDRARAQSLDHLLAGLQPDLDFQRWVPADKVAFGDRWEVPAAAMSDWLQPGGELAIEWDEAVAPDWPARWSHPGEFEGVLVLTWVDERSAGGERLAVISVTGEVSREASFEGCVPLMLVGPVPGSIDARTEYRIEAEMHWDLERGMLRSLSGEAGFRWRQVMHPDPLDRGPTGDQECVFEGTSRLEVRVDPRE